MPPWSVLIVTGTHEQVLHTDVDEIGVRIEAEVLDEPTNPIKLNRDVEVFQRTSHFDRQVLVRADFNLVFYEVYYHVSGQYSWR